MVIVILLTYIILFVRSNSMKQVKLFIDDSEIEIKEGDIFSNEIYDNKNIIKVFAFNEYFDTIVDDNIISESSLNGQFVINKVDDISTLNNRIVEDKQLSNHIIEKNAKRKYGKKTKYALGSIFKYSKTVFLTALTHFNDSNEAYLSIQDYVRFLINFWDQIDSLYANRTVVITLFGSGITRLEQKMFSNTQILQIILWTFYIRRIKFKQPAKFVILLDKSTNKNINYYKIKKGFYELQK